MVVYPHAMWMFGCRYLVARKRCVCKATKALAKTLHWRQQFRPDLITWEQVRACGTQSICTFEEFTLCSVATCSYHYHALSRNTHLFQPPCFNLKGTLSMCAQ